MRDGFLSNWFFPGFDIVISNNNFEILTASLDKETNISKSADFSKTNLDSADSVSPCDFTNFEKRTWNNPIIAYYNVNRFSSKINNMKSSDHKMRRGHRRYRTNVGLPPLLRDECQLKGASDDVSASDSVAATEKFFLPEEERCNKSAETKSAVGQRQIDCRSEVDSAKLIVGLMPMGRQDNGQEVLVGVENKGMAKPTIIKHVSRLLDLVGLSDQGEKYPSQLSGGQQQRVAVARALATSPGLLLLDEPLSALDAKVRAHLRHEIKTLHHKIGVTTIMVTHDQEEALTLADQIVIMNEGVIDQIGTPSEIYYHPTSPFVADFIGTMNCIDGKVLSNGKVTVGNIEINVPGKTRELTPGDKVKVCIRPEDVTVLDDNDKLEVANSMTIAETEFLGSFNRVHFVLPGETVPTLRADISANRARRLNINVGSKLCVVLHHDFIRLYPNTGKY